MQPGERFILNNVQLSELGRDAVGGKLRPNLLDRCPSVVTEMAARLTDESDAYGVHEVSLGRRLVVVQHGPSDEAADAAHIGALAQLHLDVAGPSPQFDLAITVENAACVLRRPHVDGVVRK